MNWHTYFMKIAEAASERSKDPTTKVGAVIVDKHGHIIGTGYNGMPPGVDETELWKDRETKYKFVIHAEENALLHSTGDCRGATIYLTLTPCAKCLGRLKSAGISNIVYRDYRADRDRDVLLVASMKGNGPFCPPMWHVDELAKYQKLNQFSEYY